MNVSRVLELDDFAVLVVDGGVGKEEEVCQSLSLSLSLSLPLSLLFL